MSSAVTISEVTFMFVSLSLEGDSPICLMAISENQKPDKPFYHVPKIEKHKKHFFHLTGMYLLMIKLNIANWSFPSCEENPEEVHISETSRGNDSVLDYLHFFLKY